MKLLHDGLNRVCDIVERILEGMVIVIVMLLVIGVLWGVFTRTRFSEFIGLTPSLWTEELARLLLIWVTFLGAAICFNKRQHLGLDYFASLLDLQAQKWLQVIVEIIIITFAALVLVWGGIVLVGETLEAGQTTAAMQLKMGYVYLAAPIAGVATILFSSRRILDLLTGESPSGEPFNVVAALRQD